MVELILSLHKDEVVKEIQGRKKKKKKRVMGDVVIGTDVQTPT